MIIPSYETLTMFFIATALGTLLGLERKRSERYFDVKIFSLSALIGSMATVFSALYGGIAEFFPLAGFILIILFTYRIYRDGEDKERIELRSGIGFKKMKTKPALKTRINKAGIDAITAYMLPVTYLIGMMTGSSMTIEAAGLTFLILGLLTIGSKLENAAKILSDEEISEIIQIGVILFIIFPLLPKEPIGIGGVKIDLFLIFAFLLLVTLLNLFVFLVYRIFRKETETITGFIGGMINSTYAIYQLNKTRKGLNSSGVTAAMLGSITRNTILVIIVMNEIVTKVIPLFIIIMAILIVLMGIERRNKSRRKSSYSLEKPVTMINTAYATLFLATVLIIFQLTATRFPEYMPIISFIASTISSGYTMLSLGSIYMTISYNELMLSIVTAILGSFATSTITSYVLDKNTGKKAFKYSLIASVLMILYLLIVHVI
jgi:uncharacterized membrane protein (DUF4010 family)